MIPTVGRIVHYVAFGTPGGEYAEGAHRAAIITEAWPVSKTASLCIFNPTGLHFRDAVPYDESGTPGTWHWPEREGDATHFDKEYRDAVRAQAGLGE